MDEKATETLLTKKWPKILAAVLAGILFIALVGGAAFAITRSGGGGCAMRSGERELVGAADADCHATGGANPGACPMNGTPGGACPMSGGTTGQSQGQGGTTCPMGGGGGGSCH